MAEETHPLQNGRFYEGLVGVIAKYWNVQLDENSLADEMFSRAVCCIALSLLHKKSITLDEEIQ